MTIVLVIDQFDDGNNGTTVTARRYAQALRRLGHTVRVVAGGGDAPDKYAVKYRYIPIVSEISATQGMRYARPNDATFIEAFKGADIVHFFIPFSLCRRGEKIARQMKIPTIGAFHMQPENITYTAGLGHVKWVNDLLYHALNRLFYNRFYHLHCPSEMIARQLREHGYTQKLHVISNGVDPVFRPTPSPRPDWAQGKFVIGMVGRLSGEKRQDLIIKAVKKSKYRDRIQLVFAGKGPKEATYRRMARGLANPSRFEFLSQAELVSLLNNLDLYIHASDAEIEGISALEALACGAVPVISNSPRSATHTFALDERSIFQAGDAADLARKIDYWIEHPQELAGMKAQYAATADDNHVLDCVRRAEDMYRQAIEDFKKLGYPSHKPSLLARLTTPRITEKNNFPFSRFKKIRVSLCQLIIAPILLVYNRLFHGFRVEGRKNLRQLRGGAVIVSNHVHYMDGCMVALALFPKRVTIVSMQENFQLPVIGYLLRLLGLIALPKEPAALVDFMRLAKQELNRGEIIHFYPEGILSPYCRELRDFHGGAFFTARQAGVPVVPLTLTFRKRTGIRKFFGKRPFVTLSIGAPMQPSGNYKQLMGEVYDRMEETVESFA
nr:glycosyltransferase [bacterium]